jgi:hypothetical protein
MKREADLDEKEKNRLSTWLNTYPELVLAYRLKEDFFNIYTVNSRSEALVKFADWEKSITPNVRDAYADLIKAWRNWQPYILNYFDHPVTNVYTKSLNNLIRVMDRLGRGYSFGALRAKILFAEDAFKKQLIKPKFECLNDPDYATIGYARAEDFASYQQQPRQTEINYGVDISTLVSMIENGEI